MQGIMQRILPLVAPQSLAIDRPILSDEERRISHQTDFNQLVQPGDLIMVATPGSFYAFFRTLTANPFDHIVVVVNNSMVLHVGPPKARLIAVERILIPSRKPKILRPKFSAGEREAFVAACENFVDTVYDVPRVYDFMFRLGLSHYVGANIPFARVAHTNAFVQSLKSKHDLKADLAYGSLPWICSDAVMWLLLSHSNALRTDLGAPPLPATPTSHPKPPINQNSANVPLLSSANVSMKVRRGWNRMLHNMTHRALENQIYADEQTVSHSDFKSKSHKPLDYSVLGSSSLNDFLSLQQRRPDLLVHVPLPPSFSALTPSALNSDSSNSLGASLLSTAAWIAKSVPDQWQGLLTVALVSVLVARGVLQPTSQSKQHNDKKSVTVRSKL